MLSFDRLAAFYFCLINVGASRRTNLIGFERKRLFYPSHQACLGWQHGWRALPIVSYDQTIPDGKRLVIVMKYFNTQQELDFSMYRASFENIGLFLISVYHTAIHAVTEKQKRYCPCHSFWRIMVYFQPGLLHAGKRYPWRSGPLSIYWQPV